MASVGDRDIDFELRTLLVFAHEAAFSLAEFDARLDTLPRSSSVKTRTKPGWWRAARRHQRPISASLEASTATTTLNSSRRHSASTSRSPDEMRWAARNIVGSAMLARSLHALWSNRIPRARRGPFSNRCGHSDAAETKQANQSQATDNIESWREGLRRPVVGSPPAAPSRLFYRRVDGPRLAWRVANRRPRLPALLAARSCLTNGR